MGTRETSHRAEPHRCSHRLLSDASPSRQHAERGVNPPRFDSEVLAVLVDPGAEAGRAELSPASAGLFSVSVSSRRATDDAFAALSDGLAANALSPFAPKWRATGVRSASLSSGKRTNFSPAPHARGFSEIKKPTLRHSNRLSSPLGRLCLKA